MVFKIAWVSLSRVTVEMAACHALSASKLFSPLFGGCGGCIASRGVPQRCMAASAQVRSEQEKKSRKAAKEETTAAHKQFPFLPTKSSRQVYVLDGELADEIARTVIKHQSNKTTPILETNPGPGVLTKALLKASARRMVLAEPLKGFMPYVQAVQEECAPHILATYHMDYLAHWRYAGDADAVYTQFEGSLSSLFPHRRWPQGAPVSVVAMVPEDKERPFLGHLIHSYGRQEGLFSLGHPEWFLALSPALYTKLLAVKIEDRVVASYNHLAIILHLLFDIRLCAQLPGWKFTPHFPEKRHVGIMQTRAEVSNSMRYLLHLRPHVNQPLPPEQVPLFYAFLGQLMQKKKLRLIPKMEQLVPGCGPYLIGLHVTMMSLVADMSPHQFLTIFKAMQRWPQYQGSPLKQLLMSGTLPAPEDDGPDDFHKDGGKGAETKPSASTPGPGHKDS